MRFTLRQMAVFVAVARRENVSRAASDVSLSQSATSTALAELERLYDTQLFDRFGRSLRLNERGQALLPQAVELLERAAAIDSVLEGRAGYGRLRIGATLTIGNYLATLIVAEFPQAAPGEQRATEGAQHGDDHRSTGAARTRSRTDRGELPPPRPGVEPWVADELVVFCCAGHPLAEKGSATLAELMPAAVDRARAGSGTRETLDQALRDDCSRLQIRLELEHTEAIKRAVEFGLGIGCISRLALLEAFRRGSLVPIATPGTRPATPLPVPLAAAQVPDRGHARVCWPVPLDDRWRRAERRDRVVVHSLRGSILPAR
jgi:DNA-binding transcriptional LysR family regulator